MTSSSVMGSSATSSTSSSTARDHALVTGATGLIGRWLVPELTRLGRHVVAVVRRAAERRAEYLAWVAQHAGVAERVTLIEGDLAADGLGLDAAGRALVRTARDVFHTGAVMQFGLTREAARRANVDGTRALIDLVRARGPGEPALRRFVHVSGYKIGDDRAFRALGIDPDAAYDPALLAPHYARLGCYEASKMEADHLVRDAGRRGLPVTRIHPATLIGDSRTGESTQLFGLAPVIEQLSRGALKAIPGGPRHWLPLASVDLVAAVMARVPELPATLGGTYVLLDEATPRLAALVAQVSARMGVGAPRHHVPIWLVRWLMCARLVPGGAAQAEGLSFISEQDYDGSSGRALAAELGLAWPALDAALDRYVDFLVATKFGTQALPSPSAA